VNTDAHILGNLIVDTDVTISGDTDLAGKVNVVGDLTATVVEASDVFVDGTLRTGGSVTVSGGRWRTTRRHIDSHGPNRRTWRFGRRG
jgi:predicted acyltransferase (DUF342 family)